MKNLKEKGVFNVRTVAGMPSAPNGGNPYFSNEKAPPYGRAFKSL